MTHAFDHAALAGIGFEPSPAQPATGASDAVPGELGRIHQNIVHALSLRLGPARPLGAAEGHGAMRFEVDGYQITLALDAQVGQLEMRCASPALPVTEHRLRRLLEFNLVESRNPVQFRLHAASGDVEAVARASLLLADGDEDATGVRLLEALVNTFRDVCGEVPSASTLQEAWS